MPFLRERSGGWSPVKIVAFAGTIVPALWIAFQAIGGELGPRPFTEAIHQSGEWTLRLLLITLAVTPALRLLRLPRLGLARRTLGVGCAAYGLLHICLYILDQHFDLLKVASEIVLRIYLTIGALALTGLTALAATSTDAAVRRLGARRWNALHRCVYAIAPLAAVHFFMQSKLNIYEPTLMAGFLVWLLGYRVLFRLNGEVAPLQLVLLACAAALVTAMGEAAIYMFTTGVDARRVLLAHLDPQMELRPAWWVLLASLAIAAAGWWRYRPARRRLRRRVAGGNAISGTQPVAAVVQRRAV